MKQKKNYQDQIPYTPKHSGNFSAALQMPWINISYLVTSGWRSLCQSAKYREKFDRSLCRTDCFVKPDVYFWILFFAVTI